MGKIIAFELTSLELCAEFMLSAATLRSMLVGPKKLVVAAQFSKLNVTSRSLLVSIDFEERTYKDKHYFAVV